MEHIRLGTGGKDLYLLGFSLLFISFAFIVESVFDLIGLRFREIMLV